MKLHTFFRAGIAVLCGAVTASAEDRFRCGEPLSLEAFRAMALHHSPLVAEIDSSFSEDLAKAIETETLHNPELQADLLFTRQELGGDNDTQVQVSLGQPVRISDFGKRSRVSELLRKSADIQKRAKLLEYTQRISLQFRTVAAYQEIERVLRSAEKRASDKVRLIKEGVKKGLLSQGEELLFEGEMYRLQAQAKGVASTIAALQNELTKSIGLKCFTAAASVVPSGELPSEEALLEAARRSAISESARAEALSELAAEQSRLAELDAVPVLAPRVIYEHTDNGGEYVGAGITMPLPFWNRNQAERTRALSEQRKADLKVRLLRAGGLEEQISNLRRAAASADEQARIYSAKVLPAFEGTLRSQEKLYGEGKGNVLQVWQTLRAFNEVQTQGVQLQLEAASARIQLAILVGEEV